MHVWIITSLILITVTVISIAVEPRRMRNAIYLAATFIWLMLLGIELLTKHQSPVSAGVMTAVILLLPLIYIALAVFLIVNGFILIKKEGRSRAAMLSPVSGAAMILAMAVIIIGMGGPAVLMPVWLTLITFDIFFYVFISLFCYLLYSLLYSLLPKKPECDYIIIHGAGLMEDGTPTPLLKKRIDKAIELWHRCGDSPVLIPSGGKGGDEIISESESMSRYLRDSGIDMTKVITEDKSTSTFENLVMVKELLDVREKGNKYKCMFVTSNYHVLRTAFYSRKIKLNAQGVGCRTAGYYLPSAFLREYAAMMVRLKWVAVMYAAFCALLFWGIYR